MRILFVISLLILFVILLYADSVLFVIHQDIKVIEKLYQGRWDEAIMGDYLWTLVLETSSTFKQKSRFNVHFLSSTFL